MNFAVKKKENRTKWRRCLALLLVLFILLFCRRRFLISAFALDPLESLNEALVETIRDGFYAFSDEIDISRFEIKPEELTAVFSAVIKNDPYLFFVESRLSYSYQPGGHVLRLKPLYKMPKEEAEKAWQNCREQVREIALLAEGDATRKALFLHDYICLHFDYDDSLQNDNIYDFLKTGKGTCQGYTLLYMALLQEVGIQSVFAASDSISHIWNLICLDGQWYHADLTWDDSGTKEGGAVSRRHFLLSDKMAGERGHKDWYAPLPVICNSELYADCDFDALLHGEILPGDVDHDRRVTLADLLYLRQICSATGEAEAYFLCIRCADLNQDGCLNEADIVALRRKLLILELTDFEK